MSFCGGNFCRVAGLSIFVFISFPFPKYNRSISQSSDKYDKGAKSHHISELRLLLLSKQKGVRAVSRNGGCLPAEIDEPARIGFWAVPTYLPSSFQRRWDID